MQGGHKEYRYIIRQVKKDIYIYATKYITSFRLITSTRKSQSLPQYQWFSSIERQVEGFPRPNVRLALLLRTNNLGPSQQALHEVVQKRRGSQEGGKEGVVGDAQKAGPRWFKNPVAQV
jgi:hypothetical protein